MGRGDRMRAGGGCVMCDAAVRERRLKCDAIRAALRCGASRRFFVAAKAATHKATATAKATADAKTWSGDLRGA